MISYRSNLLGMAAPPPAPDEPVRKGKRLRTYRPWEEHEITTVVNLLADGKSRSEVAHAVGRAWSSVKSLIESIDRGRRAV